ncbi:MAG TPA: amidohydrolase family protein [Solirubrobacterales bacterium]|nr:amidohydrolase family protein [Solirubrobacterales bacterium]
MTASISTATGPIDAGDLGRVSMHEHILIVNPALLEYPDILWNGEKGERLDQAVRELDRLKALGIDTLVDLTVAGLGRSIADVLEIAARTELQIVLATGFYTFADLPASLRTRSWRRDADGAIEDVLVDMFVRDIEAGIAGTSAKAAILKCCTDEAGMTKGVERVIRAAAWAHRATGVPITTHTHAASHSGREQQRVLAEEGVDLSRVIIGHCGDSLDLDYLRELMDRGSTIGSDRFGFYIPGAPTLAERVDVIARLVAEGYADRIVLGHDAHCYAEWNHEDDPFRSLEHWQYDHLPTEVLPLLREAGVSDEDLDRMLVSNPVRLLRRGSPY